MSSDTADAAHDEAASDRRAAIDPLAGLEDPDARSATIICVANQKGGVGKTTTTVSLAAALANEGAQVLVVDLDPQGNATTGLGLRAQEGAPSTYRVLVEGLDVEDAAEPTAVRGLHVLPSSLDLAGAEIELVPAFSRESRLKNALEAVRDLYDVVLIDCPPSLGLLTINAFVAADQVLVPIQCEYYALEGLGQLMRTVKLVGDSLNRDLELGGVVLTMYDARTNLSQQVVDEVREFFGDRAYQTIIPRTVRLSEAPSYGQPITVFDSSSRGARAYRRLAREVARRLDLELDEEERSPLDRLLGATDVPSGTPAGDEAPAENAGLPTDLSRDDVPLPESGEAPLTVRVRPDIIGGDPAGEADDGVSEDPGDVTDQVDALEDAPIGAVAEPAPPIRPGGPDYPGEHAAGSSHTTALEEAGGGPDAATEAAQDPASAPQWDDDGTDIDAATAAAGSPYDASSQVGAGDQDPGPAEADDDPSWQDTAGPAGTPAEETPDERPDEPLHPATEPPTHEHHDADRHGHEHHGGEHHGGEHHGDEQHGDEQHGHEQHGHEQHGHEQHGHEQHDGGHHDDHGHDEHHHGDEHHDGGHHDDHEHGEHHHGDEPQHDHGTAPDDRPAPHEQGEGWTRPWEEQG